ncbi:MAG: hemerythrin domain-containing protein [Desulfobulbus sp.]|jgi:hemerythrin-like domain-containing protein|nr:hemerythrin domain-containing protein [Desulfobulbus sp.]
MAAIDELNCEHQVIEQMLRVLRVLAHRLRLGATMIPAHLDGVLEFLEVFVDQCHHAKEEEHLFPALEAVGVRNQGGPLEAMCTEHRRGRELVVQMREALDLWATNRLNGGLVFAGAAEEYQALMLQHMDKESGVLFAAADIRLSKDTDQELTEAFARLERERIGDGVHQRLHAVFDQMCTLYLN